MPFHIRDLHLAYLWSWALPNLGAHGVPIKMAGGLEL